MTYTLTQIQELYSCRRTLTKDRFEHYMDVYYGEDKHTIKEMWKMWEKFPSMFYTSDIDEKIVNKLTNRVIEITRNIEKSWQFQLKKIGSYEKDGRLIIYEENGEIKKAEIDLLNSVDIIAYSEIIKRAKKVHDVLALLEEIDLDRRAMMEHNGEKMKIYEGDIICANDNYWGDGKSGLYLAQKSNSGVAYDAAYKKLLYIKGKGYVMNGEPNIDESKSYNYHVLTLKDNWFKLGNLATDFHLLKDC